jgi:hypothetical protein
VALITYHRKLPRRRALAFPSTVATLNFVSFVKNIAAPATAEQILDALGVSQVERRKAGALAKVIAKSRPAAPLAKKRALPTARSGRAAVAGLSRSTKAKRAPRR